MRRWDAFRSRIRACALCVRNGELWFRVWSWVLESVFLQERPVSESDDNAGFKATGLDGSGVLGHG